MGKKVFELEMKVRDYECDSQGIVNNANYMHYFEATRHEFLESEGISFAEDHKKGIDPVVSKATLEYKSPLTGGEKFRSSLTVEKNGIRILFHQQVHRMSDNQLCCKGTTEVVILINGKLSTGDYYDKPLREYLD